MDDHREFITNEPPPRQEDRIQDTRPEPLSPYRDERDPYDRDDDYDYRRFRRDTPLAGRGARWGARIIDGLLTILAALPGILIGISLLNNNVRAADEDAWIILAVAVGGIGVLALLIYQWYLLTTQGQTIGKKAVGVRVVRYEDEANPGFVGAVLLREWVPGLIGQVPYLGGIFGLVDVLCIFGEERRCIHDQIAKTKVIDASAYEPPESRLDEAYP